MERWDGTARFRMFTADGLAVAGEVAIPLTAMDDVARSWLAFRERMA